MHEIKHLQAFASYKAKPSHRGRSAVTAEGALVVSCWYGGFKKADVEILRYEEDLSEDTGGISAALRAHVQDAMTRECHVHLIIARALPGEKAAAGDDPTKPLRPARTTYHPRKDLVGQVKSFDGQRFVIDFRRAGLPASAQGKASKRSAHTRRAS